MSDNTRVPAEELFENMELPSTDAVLTAEQEEMIEKLDKESATRKLSSPLLNKIFYILCIGVTFYHLYTVAFIPPATLKHRSLHVAMILALSFIMYPFGKNSSRKKVTWCDWVLVALSCTIPVYMWTNYLGIVSRAGAANTIDLLFATILIVLVIESARRASGWALPIISSVFLLYGLFGKYLPSMFMHRGYTWTALSNHLFANTEGIFGTSVQVAASYIFMFILFGAVMNKSGMGKFFNDIAMALAGHTKGGPAKVAVLASGLLGSINGSAVANVVTTGAFTIPLMKKVGYSKEFAGAVESSASVGGQLLPPVMGAAAFIMAEMLGIKYREIIICAAVPALLYYLGILVQVQLRASKENLVGVPRERLPKTMQVMRERGHLMIPIILLLYLLMFTSMTVSKAAFFTIIANIICAQLRKDTRMSVKDIFDALADGTKQTVPVAIACACVGIVIGVTSKTGFGLTMANTIVSIGQSNLMFTLIFTMVTCMILGMGVPSIPAYIITASIAAPALHSLGVPLIAAHLFVFYFAMFANITPPVALAAMAASGLSGGNFMKTGFASVKLSLAGFIVPYMFVYSTQLLLIDTTFLQGLQVTLMACLGVFLIGVAIEGYLSGKVNIVLRVLAFGGALLLIDPRWQTDLMGLVILLLVVGPQYFKYRQKQKAQIA